MEFWEKTKKTASTIFARAGKKAGEVYSGSKVRLSIMEAKNELTKTFEEIGRLTYKTAREEEDNHDMIEQKMDEVTSLKNKIELLKEKLKSEEE